MAESLNHKSPFERFTQEHLLCSICQEVFKEPTTLTCSHTFCRNCLLAYQQSPRKKGTCPICRKVTVPVRGDINNLTSDFKLTCMIDTIEQENKLAEKLEKPTCKTHTGKKCWVYCETCNELICLACVTGFHNGHTVEEISETVADEKRHSLVDHLPKIEKVLVDITQFSDAVPRIEESLQVAYANSRKDVEDKAIEEIAKINSQKQLIINELHEIEKKGKLSLAQYKDNLNGIREKFQRSLSDSKLALKVHNDCAFIQSYRTLMSAFHSQNECKPTQFETNLASFQPNETHGFCLGKLIPTPLNLEQIEPNPPNICKWKKIPSAVSSGGRGVAALLNGCVVADPWGQAIVTNVLSSTVRMSCKPNYPRDVSAVDCRVIAVDDSKFIKVYNRSTQSISQSFPTVPPSKVKNTPVDLRCVAVKEDGTVVVGDAKRSVLSELSLQDGHIKRVFSVKTPPEFLAVNDQSQMLVSGEYSGTAEMLDSDGESQFTITPYINHARVRCCTGVCWSKSGIYLAMHNKNNGSGHVHHYDDKGRFIECVTKGLELPQGISITDDETKLIIADYHEVKMFSRI